MTDEGDRAAIELATTKLIDGSVEGPLTVVRLAEVAGLKRWKLTHKHTDLMHRFQNQIGMQSTRERLESELQTRLDSEVDKNRALAGENRRLNSVLERYVVVISELSFDLTEALKSSKSESSNVLRFIPSDK